MSNGPNLRSVVVPSVSYSMDGVNISRLVIPHKLEPQGLKRREAQTAAGWRSDLEKAFRQAEKRQGVKSTTRRRPRYLKSAFQVCLEGLFNDEKRMNQEEKG